MHSTNQIKKWKCNKSSLKFNNLEFAIPKQISIAHKKNYPQSFLFFPFCAGASVILIQSVYNGRPFGTEFYSYLHWTMKSWIHIW